LLLLENLNYFKTGAYEHICDPEFISQVLEENDVFLLLDTAHVVVSAFNMGMDIYDYLNQLPLEKIFEVHLSKPGFINGNMEDLHSLPDEDEYKILSFLLKHSSPLYIAIEYYKDKDLLLDAYKILKKRLDKTNIS